MIGVEKNENGDYRPIPASDAQYRFNPQLIQALKMPTARMSYPNMLPLLLQLFPSARILAVGTEASIAAQKVLLRERYPDELQRLETFAIEDIHDYREIFRTLDSLMERDDEIVVDISHSFRHLPALMMVDMIIENIKTPGKIRHILFAKELEARKRYVIVDLREYLTLANVSYALASFTKNYTVATTVRTVDEIYQALLLELSKFSDHILANSFEALLYPGSGQPPVAQRVIDIIELAKRHERTRDLIHPLVPALDAIARHMEEILIYADEPLDRRFQYFSLLMFDKGYLLNSMTLLDEAVAAYCVEAFRRIPETANYVKKFEKAIHSHKKSKLLNQYTLSNTAKNIVKLRERYNLNRDKRDDEGIVYDYGNALKNYLQRNNGKKIKSLGKFIDRCDALRNNLAHGNSDRRLDNVRRELRELLDRYEEVCRFEDPLKRFQ
jgi:CRISPR-associated DxTHG motif protein